MTTDTDFLRAVLPDQGTYCVTGIKDGVAKNIFVNDIESIHEEAKKLVDKKINAFYAMATYREDESGELRRKQSQTQWLKSFWIDVDCGEDKPYKSQLKGLQALRDFQEETELPTPFIINSGNGLHVYWLLKEYIDNARWTPVAKKLKAACKKFGFEVDRSVMSDSARVLRIPDTCNFKDPENPKAVTVDQRGTMTTIEEFEGILDTLGLPVQKTPTKRVNMSELSETAKALIGNKVSKFSKIVRKSVKGEGCNAIKEIVCNQEGIDEPLWRAGLAIAWACEDADKAIHLMSNKHPDYDPDETIEKASLTLGPYTCDTIREIDPDLCEGCTQKCTSPIQLGTEIKRDTGSLFDAPDEHEVPEGDGSLSTQSVQKALYKPPFPYFRGANGGIYVEERDADGDKVEKLIYDYDLYPVKRIKDPNDGESIVMRLHLPQDGMSEFILPAKKLMAGDSFRDILGGQGVVAGTKQMKDIMEYTIRFTKELQRKQKASLARLQYGWADSKQTWVVGHSAYTKKGVEHNPASSTTSNVHNDFIPKGNLDKWKEAFNMFTMRPNMEAQQLVALSGFGAPLMPFTGLVGGATINLVSNGSGTGKSSAGLAALSIFGNPQGTLLTKEDTYMARLHRLGVLNNLVCVSDEMTNMDASTLSNMLYAVSQGRARHRMEKDANRERINSSTWKTILCTNSNSSYMSKLSKAKARPDGEMMRLMEIHTDPVFIPEGEKLMAQLDENYGVAGQVYAPWLVRHMEELPAAIDEQKERIRKAVGHEMSERFWIGTVSAILVGGRAAKRLGLHDYDMDALEKWIIKQILKMRGDVKDEVVDADSLVGDFLMDHSNAILALGTKINPRTGDNIWMHSRSAKLMARFELEDNTMYIAKKAFREYCVNRQFTEAEALKECAREGSNYRYIKTTKKRMMAGTNITAPAVQCHVFKCSEEESAEIFSTLERASAKEDGDQMES